MLTDQVPKPIPPAEPAGHSRPSVPPGRRQRQPRYLDKTGVHRMAMVAMLLALGIVLSWFEDLLPPIPSPVPGKLKIGLSNIAVMYTLFFVGVKEALLLALLKAFFAYLTRGFMAACLSLGGGLLSVLLMWLLTRLPGRSSWLLLSAAGAVAHNLGQYGVLCLFFQGVSLWWVLPYLLIFGLATGILSASLLRVIMPALRRLPGYRELYSENVPKR
ncbi:MAG: Gx transporter family protein [Oscillospiraceae bacterium]|nr:Gx transporter family protein [Oscillospiraceae bacterium]MDD4367528.1 Gx transporter family protein [Oscillospiraceae bacterium]